MRAGYFVIALSVVPCPAFGDFTGRVVNVADGDTLSAVWRRLTLAICAWDRGDFHSTPRYRASCRVFKAWRLTIVRYWPVNDMSLSDPKRSFSQTLSFGNDLVGPQRLPTSEDA